MRKVKLVMIIRLTDEGKILPADREMLRLNLQTIEAVAQSKAVPSRIDEICSDGIQSADIERLMN